MSKKVKKFLMTLAILNGALFLSQAAFAEQFGSVDVEAVLQNYSKTQDVNVEFKAKEADLQKFVADARKSLQLTQNKHDRTVLETKYNKELQEKAQNLKKEQIKTLNVLQSDISDAIKQVAAKKQIKVIFNKNSVILGADDMTADVISVLNNPSK